MFLLFVSGNYTIRASIKGNVSGHKVKLLSKSLFLMSETLRRKFMCFKSAFTLDLSEVDLRRLIC
jgi:hypothetical protein